MGGSRSSKEDSSDYKRIEEEQARKIAEMGRQMEQQRKQAQVRFEKLTKSAEDTKKAEEAERKKQAEIEAGRIQQQNIQAENQSAADFRRQSENKIQSNFNSSAQNQQRLDQQSAQNYSTAVGGSGYNVGSVQQQKIAAAGGIAGPASTNAPSSMQMGLPPILASNKGVGGSQQNTNQFNLPSAQGLQFGGM